MATKGAVHKKYPGKMNDLENVIGVQINLQNKPEEQSPLFPRNNSDLGYLPGSI
jgi:hypothetical protein